MGLLLRFEAFPEWFTRTIPGYRGVFAESLLARQSWARILIAGRPAGYIHTSLGVDDEARDHHLEINSRLHLRVALPGLAQRVLANTTVKLDRDYQLAGFSTAVTAGEITLRADGLHTGKRQFEITTVVGGRSTTRTVGIPREVLIYSPVQELALRNLRDGNRLALLTLNPLTLRQDTVLITSLGRESISIGGRDVAATRLRTSWQGVDLDSWVDADGALLRQETPLGWIIETCSADEALAAVAADTEPPPLFASPLGHAFWNLLTPKGPPPHDRD